MPNYEFFEHTADIGFRAFGSTLEAALSAACEALTSVMTGGTPVEPQDEVSFTITASDHEQLVVDLLSHLVYLADAEDFIAGSCIVKLHQNLKAHITAHGERFDPKRHSEGLEVKAVAYHMLQVEQQASGQWMIQVLLDV